MRRRAPIIHSRNPMSHVKMNASLVLLVCGVVGSAVGYYVRDAPYNVGPNDPYSVAVSTNFQPEPSQRLFWGNQGSNQVGGTGLWATLTNKFPFLGNMFGRLEAQGYAPPQYISPQYGIPSYTPQFYQQPPVQQFPFGREVGFTDDAVIVTPPHVPLLPEPAPAPVQPPSSGYQYNKPQYRLELPQK